MINKIKNFFSLIESKLHYSLICLLIFFGSIIEVLGISVAIPFIEVLTNSTKKTFYNKYLFDFSNYFKIDLITLIILILFLFFSIRLIYLVFLNYIQNKYVSIIQNRIANKIYSSYISQSQEAHMMISSSVIIRDLTNDINAFTGLIQSLFLFFIDIFFLFLILILIIYLVPLKLISLILILLGASYLILILIKYSSSKLGLAKTQIEQLRIKNIQQSFGAIKEIKISRNEFFFIQSFSILQKKLSRLFFKQNFYQNLPKLGIEYIGLIILLSFIFINIKVYNIDANIVVSGLALLFLLLIRILPSIIRLLNSAQNIHFYNPSIENLKKILKLDSKKLIKNLSKRSSLRLKKFPKNIFIKNLSFEFSNSKRKIFQNFYSKIPINKITLVKGDSGRGKSTFIDILTGIIKPLKGGVWLNNQNIYDSNSLLKKWQNTIGYVPQSLFIFDDTVVKNIAVGVDEKFIDQKKIVQIIKLLKIDKFLNKKKNGIDALLGENGISLSGGEKQKIGIARALYKEPSVLILDESTNAMDLNTEKEIMNNLKKIKTIKFIIIVSHKKKIKSFYDHEINLNKIQAI